MSQTGLRTGWGLFLDVLANRKTDLDIYLFQCSGGVLIAPVQAVPSLRVKFVSLDQGQLTFDCHHPVGTCHHQKIVVIDEVIGFCVGI